MRVVLFGYDYGCVERYYGCKTHSIKNGWQRIQKLPYPTVASKDAERVSQERMKTIIKTKWERLREQYDNSVLLLPQTN